jgi:hypothetical protein
MIGARYRKSSGAKEWPRRVAADKNSSVDAESCVLSVESCRDEARLSE